MSSENDEYKERIRNAVLKASAKALKEYQPTTRHNEKPEKEVEGACLFLMRSWGWSMQIFESKATYDPRAGRYIGQAMKSGTLDSGGSTNEGIAAWVEFKAPGKLNTLRDGQRTFILEKIAVNNFACVTDSSDRLNDIHKHWSFLRRHGNIDAAREYLISMLPKEKAPQDTGPLFSE